MSQNHKFAAIALACAILAPLPSFGATPRLAKTINRDWTFGYFPNETPEVGCAAITYDDSHWQAVAIPHTWSTYETTLDLHPFIRSATERDDTYWWYGWGWYRKHFSLSSESSKKLVFLECDGVQKYAKFYLNGHLVSEHKGGYTSFSLEITPFMNWDGDNVLAVQVSNRRDDPFGTIPPATAGNFDVYGGIYRDVRLVLTDPLHVPFQGSAEHEGGTFVTTPVVAPDHATVHVRTWVKNDFPQGRTATLTTFVRDRDHTVVAKATSTIEISAGNTIEFDQDLGTIVQPHLWSPDAPYLYQVDSELNEGSRLADTFQSPLGIRSFRWDYSSNRMILNGHEILLRGMNRHQEFPWLGDAMPKWIHSQDLADMRYHLGLNFQRTVHYPNDPLVYTLCDQLGFMLIEESPNIKDITFGRGIQEQQMKEMIRRDRNHPSILIWSMGNESNQPADSAWAAAEDASRIIYLRRGENGGKFVQLTDKNLPIENLLRCTVRGWLDEDDHDFGEQTGHPASSQVTGTEEWQAEKNRGSDRLLTGNVVVWLYADHGADRHYLDSPVLNINPKGWVDAYRFPKLTYYLWEANYTQNPMMFIHPTYWRPQYRGQRRAIRVDSNCESVELSLDGKFLGRQEPSNANAHSVIFENVPVGDGVLVATGSLGGQHVKNTLAMAGPPSRIVLSTGQKEIPADRSGIAIIALDLVDDRGNHVYSAHPPLTWNVEGPAHLIGPARYISDIAKHEAMDGTMYIDAPVANLVRANATPGEITVTVSSPGLPDAKISLHSLAPSVEDIGGITEPRVSDDGRAPVRRDVNFQARVLSNQIQIISEIPDDVSFPGPLSNYREQVEAFIKLHSAGVNPFTSEYRAFIERLVAIVTQREGHLIADDFNFNARDFNERMRAKSKAKNKN